MYKVEKWDNIYNNKKKKDLFAPFGGMQQEIKEKKNDVMEKKIEKGMVD